MKYIHILFLVLFSNAFCAQYYEGTPVDRIIIQLESEDSSLTIDTKAILSKMKTKKGDQFSQTIFDQDLKEISKDYDRIYHNEQIRDNKLYITIKVWPRPTISSINFEGNKKIRTSRLQSELEVSPGEIFNLQDFNDKFNKLKEYYVKKGYFESQLSYKIVPVPESDQIEIDIQITEGKSGNIQRISYRGFSLQERKDLQEMVLTKKYNFLTSWLTGNGFYNQDMIENDKLIIINYLHNKGYADARVKIFLQDDVIPGQIAVIVEAERGKVYRFGKITFEGNTLIPDDKIKDSLMIQENQAFSPEQLHNATQGIKDLYGKDGYIETDVQYETFLSHDKPLYNVHLQIQEGDQYKIGMVHVFGNKSTNANVILRESLLTPGDLFDSRRLKATQMRLENIGYFKNVNVYAVRTKDDTFSGENYRDVYIEVEETQTGSINMSVGASSSASVFGSIELSENNFNSRGILKLFNGLGNLRGGGEHFDLKASFGAKDQNFVMNWLNPYFNDSLWRVGVTSSFTVSRLQSDANKITTWGATFYASYPLTPYITYGTRYRLRHTKSKVQGKVDEKKGDTNAASTEAIEEKNHGIVSAPGTSISYNSLDRPYKPHRGVYSNLDAEFAGVGGDFYFIKTSLLNSIYFPVTNVSALKFKGNFQFIIPLWDTRTEGSKLGGAEGSGVPSSERFFLGGVDSVRGYKPYIIGPTFANKKEPTGGISSGLVSVEYNHELLKILDVFAFFDAGNIRMRQFSLPINKFRASYGFGIRLEIMGQVPITLGMGYPINPEFESDVENFFFSMGGRF